MLACCTRGGCGRPSTGPSPQAEAAAKRQQAAQDRLAELERVLALGERVTADELERAVASARALESERECFEGWRAMRFELVHDALIERWLAQHLSRARPLAEGDAQAVREALYAFASIERHCRALRKDRGNSKHLRSKLDELTTQIESESDELCPRGFTPEFVSAQPWHDLLDVAWSEPWQADACKYEIDERGLRARGPEPSSGKEGLVSVPKREQWRDFQLELELEFRAAGDAATVRVFLNVLHRAADAIQAAAFELGPSSGEPQWMNRTRVQFTLIGRSLRVEYPGGEHPPEQRTLGSHEARRGGLALSVPPSTAVAIRAARVRLLRTDRGLPSLGMSPR